MKLMVEGKNKKNLTNQTSTKNTWPTGTIFWQAFTKHINAQPTLNSSCFTTQ